MPALLPCFLPSFRCRQRSCGVSSILCWLREASVHRILLLSYASISQMAMLKSLPSEQNSVMWPLATFCVPGALFNSRDKAMNETKFCAQITHFLVGKQAQNRGRNSTLAAGLSLPLHIARSERAAETACLYFHFLPGIPHPYQQLQSSFYSLCPQCH